MPNIDFELSEIKDHVINHVVYWETYVAPLYNHTFNKVFVPSDSGSLCQLVNGLTVPFALPN